MSYPRNFIRFIYDLNQKLKRSAAFAYLTILLLQMKILSGFIRYPGLSTGDTSSYFTTAYDWHHTGHTLLSWSPLYTSFYGSFFRLSDDAFVVTAAHRMAIVLILAILVLALMRRLLPPELAWLMTAWWVVMPINFNSLYEVHLFAVIPVLSALLLSLAPAPWGIGGALGVLLTSALLMRNELIITFAVLACALTAGELHKRLLKSPADPASRFPITPFLVPLLAALSLFGFFCSRAKDLPVLRTSLDRKHSLNICQVYAFGYQQRHSDFSASPWTDCQQLMTRIYGEREPSLVTALRKNPRAILEHFAWNVSLIPNGLQLLLLNAISGTVNPDYVEVVSRSRFALWSSLALVVLMVWGTELLIKKWNYWWQNLLASQQWFWVTALGLAVTSVWVMVMQRPRASYQLAFGIVIRAIFAMMIMVIAWHWWIVQRLRAAYPLFVLLAIVFIAPYDFGHGGRRALLDTYRRLYPFEKLFRTPGVKLLSAGWSSELCFYLSRSGASCQPFDYSQIRETVNAGMPFVSALATLGVNVVYADANMLQRPSTREFIRDAKRAGWITIERQGRGDQSWALLADQPRAETLLAGSELADIVEDEGGITLGNGWHDLERNSGVTFRWASSGAEIVLPFPPCDGIDLTLNIAPGPGVNSKPFVLQVLDRKGQKIAGASVGEQSILKLHLPVEGCAEALFRLHAAGGGHLAPNDMRIMDFRVMNISREP